MLWKLNGKIMKTPSTYKDNIEDTDNDSYTSKVTGALIDNPIAVRNAKAWNVLGLFKWRRSRRAFTGNISKSDDHYSKMSKCTRWHVRKCQIQSKQKNKWNAPNK